MECLGWEDPESRNDSPLDHATVAQCGSNFYVKSISHYLLPANCKSIAKARDNRELALGILPYPAFITIANR